VSERVAQLAVPRVAQLESLDADAQHGLSVDLTDLHMLRVDRTVPGAASVRRERHDGVRARIGRLHANADEAELGTNDAVVGRGERERSHPGERADGRDDSAAGRVPHAHRAIRGAGVAVFLAGGIADIVWHLVFGIEVSVEALLSPTHLLLAAGFLLVVGGPIRAWFGERRGWWALGPARVAVTLGYAVLSFFTSYADPFVDSYAATAYRGGDLYSPVQRILGPPDPLLPQSLGLAGILLQSALLGAVLAVIARRWRLRFGAIPLLLALDGALLSVIHDQYRLIPAAVLAGLIGDVLWRWSPPWPRTWLIRLVAAGTPAALYALYFLMLAVTGGIWWSLHLWTGAIVLAGLAGLGVAVLATPGEATAWVVLGGRTAAATSPRRWSSAPSIASSIRWRASPCGTTCSGAASSPRWRSSPVSASWTSDAERARCRSRSRRSSPARRPSGSNRTRTS